MSVAALMAAALPSPAAAVTAAVTGTVTGAPGIHPLFIQVKVRAKRCARLVPRGGREIIINDCSQCKVVNITRKRPGIAVPVSRTFNVQPKSTFPVPFRGPGRSRVTSVLPCRGEKGAARNLVDDKPIKRTPKACVSLAKGKAGGIVLVNECKACKAVLIERQGGSGRTPRRQAYKMAAQSVQVVSSNGATRVGLITEINCPK